MVDDRTAGAQVLRGITVPVTIAVAVVVAIAWLVTWATSDVMMSLPSFPMGPPTPLELAAFFLLLVVMMVAMMLPSALPMVVAFRGLTRLERGRSVRPADNLATALFVTPYFLLWGGFGVLALLGLLALGLVGSMESPMPGPITLAPGFALLLAGTWQVTRTKEVCLSHCQSPMGFVMRHWRSGRFGAFRMAMRHSLYCIGCCWLFMIVLFVAGAMSLAWMGGLSVAIFAEKVGWRADLIRRGIGVVLVVLGAALLLPMVLG